MTGTPQNTDQLVAEIIRLIRAWEPGKPLVPETDTDTPKCEGCPDGGPWHGVRMCETQHYDGTIHMVYYCSECQMATMSDGCDVHLVKVFS